MFTFPMVPYKYQYITWPLKPVNTLLELSCKVNAFVLDRVSNCGVWNIYWYPIKNDKRGWKWVLLNEIDMNSSSVVLCICRNWAKWCLLHTKWPNFVVMRSGLFLWYQMRYCHDYAVRDVKCWNSNQRYISAWPGLMKTTLLMV